MIQPQKPLVDSLYCSWLLVISLCSNFSHSETAPQRKVVSFYVPCWKQKIWLFRQMPIRILSIHSFGKHKKRFIINLKDYVSYFSHSIEFIWFLTKQMLCKRKSSKAQGIPVIRRCLDSLSQSKTSNGRFGFISTIQTHNARLSSVI